MIPETYNRKDWPRLVKQDRDKLARRLAELERLTRAKMMFLHG